MTSSTGNGEVMSKTKLNNQPDLFTGHDSEKAKPKPFVKWAGGKRQLLEILNEKAPKITGRYFEPFLGGGALFFSRLPMNATISDANEELINCYIVIRDDVEALIEDLRTHQNTEEHFYKTRALDLTSMTPLGRASRFIFLNKTCFNGLYRVNKKGLFNVPYGKYANPNFVDEKNLRAISAYLNEANVEIICADYKTVLEKAVAGDFVFCDPPFQPTSKTASFTNYVKEGFGPEDQAELAELVKELGRRGVKVMLSNSNTDAIRDLYQEFDVIPVMAKRSISCKVSSRGKAHNEVLITNY
jgi:DNA adenine methylase